MFVSLSVILGLCVSLHATYSVWDRMQQVYSVCLGCLGGGSLPATSVQCVWVGGGSLHATSVQVNELKNLVHFFSVQRRNSSCRSMAQPWY